MLMALERYFLRREPLAGHAVGRSQGRHRGERVRWARLQDPARAAMRSHEAAFAPTATQRRRAPVDLERATGVPPAERSQRASRRAA